MTIDEAIEIFTRFESGLYTCDAVTFRVAVKMGRGALKRLKTMRGYCSPGSGPLLPGETKD